MEFVLTSDVLIEFALNMAGYLVITLLLYVLLHRRAKRRDVAAIDQPVTSAPVPDRVSDEINIDVLTPAADEVPAPNVSRLPKHPIMDDPDIDSNKNFDKADDPLPATAFDRQSNRRAIYREARRLLANGKTRHELLDRLPLTEDELELIVTTG